MKITRQNELSSEMLRNLPPSSISSANQNLAKPPNLHKYLWQYSTIRTNRAI